MKQIIAMHGWYSDMNTWTKWDLFFKSKNWHWESGERGYGKLKPYMPNWHMTTEKGGSKKHVLICHSLGLHLIGDHVLADTTDLILLCSFSNFIPKTKEAKRLKIALTGMKKALGTKKEEEMLQNFLAKVSYPNPYNNYSKGLLEEGLSCIGREMLSQDLSLLMNTKDLPIAMPKDARVLVINGKNDKIIDYSVKVDLIQDLKHITTKISQWDIENEGHFIESDHLMKRIDNWINLE